MAIVELTDRAEDDLLQIWYYIAVENHSRGNADSFIDKIEQSFYKLAHTPMMGTARNMLAPDLRGWPFGNYMIYYLPVKNGVKIIRVIHGKRDIGQQKSPIK